MEALIDIQSDYYSNSLLLLKINHPHLHIQENQIIFMNLDRLISTFMRILKPYFKHENYFILGGFAY